MSLFKREEKSLTWAKDVFYSIWYVSALLHYLKNSSSSSSSLSGHHGWLGQDWRWDWSEDVMYIHVFFKIQGDKIHDDLWERYFRDVCCHLENYKIYSVGKDMVEYGESKMFFDEITEISVGWRDLQNYRRVVFLYRFFYLYFIWMLVLCSSLNLILENILFGLKSFLCEGQWWSQVPLLRISRVDRSMCSGMMMTFIIYKFVLILTKSCYASDIIRWSMYIVITNHYITYYR